ncbi:Mu transposase C-terminal domain-containing protein [Streptantibioticus ferralitis]|uniref:DDE-type integrase/transposase/recombinase n=1 Tax=Streptantibioticus ferralitis TaxID=236510 RepID=A0ABT5YYZ0_9ACTN|nr:Mu transposase C-terminal domain-containing protein [Streptantibioticus ferralitis]MDF2256005.1 DDE-type integrase/transposase/recombinase [Streptantibioticus ferralitis]
MAEEPVAERGVLSAPTQIWETAVRQAEVIGPLAEKATVGLADADEAAERLRISRRQVYVLLRRWRAGEGVVSDLLPGRSSGGRGGGRLSSEVETIVQEVLRTRYLTRQRRSVAAVCKEITRQCRSRGLRVPSRGTVVRRITRLDPVSSLAAREGSEATRPLRSAGGVPPPVTGLLEQVQVDHTPVDVIVVDERHRLPIGRPCLTATIDVASRCVVGLVVTLEAPSATSVGLCLAHAAMDKRPWLERLGVEALWPMSGKPHELYVDNAAEFKSEALRRGCDQHGIALRYRPPGQPHFGGIIERLIGTMMQLVHELPGTTFSSTAERSAYNSDEQAALTLRELQRWMALAVACYHGQVHETPSRTPAGVWAEKAAGAGRPVTVTNETAFLVDFLPVIRRTLSRSGFVIDHVQYHCNALRPWIARRERLDRFVLRRDPRDISRVWALDPDGTEYVEVPYRTLSRPPISAWEQKAAAARLRELGRAEVDENTLFAMVAQMREITETAAVTTRKARRDRQRCTEAPSRPQSEVTPAKPPAPDVGQDDEAGARPFEVIEQW